MRVLIVDDEPLARAKLRRMLAPWPALEVVGEAGDGVQALQLCATLAPDAVFLDVQMPGCSGLDVAASLPDPAPAVVFVTAFDRYALQAFDAAALDYLLKPVEPERLARAVQRLLERDRPAAAPALPAQQLLIADRGRVHVVDCAQIDWLEAADNYVAVHVGAREWLMRRPLAALLADLPSHFARVHRSAAVNLHRVAHVLPRGGKGDALVVLRSGTEVPCSRAWRAALVARLGPG